MNKKEYEAKCCMYDILMEVDRICKKNNIKYTLAYGTLLGAIRHKGFIPWDDDIDIGMLREDYDKFLKLYHNKKSRYQLYASELNKDYYYQSGKVYDTKTILYEPDETGVKLSVYVDVFVYDNAPDDDKLVKKMYDKRDLYNKLRLAQLYPDMYDKTSLKKKIMRFFLNVYLKFLPKNYYTKKGVKLTKKYANTETKRIGNFTSAARIKVDKKAFSSFTDVTFEKKKYPAPIGYKEYLQAFYGDYTKDPPKEKQVSHHKFKAYYKGENDE
jgi:lipopolysaccharide cholinephosphotransferase